MIDQPRQTREKLSSSQNAELRKWRAKFNALANDIVTEKHIDLNSLFPLPQNQDILLEQLSELEKCLDSFRPFSVGHMRILQEQYDTEYTYESNRIEGNTLSYQETDLVVNKGMTIGGKPLKDHLEAINHQEAIAFIRLLASNETPFGESELLKLHSIILQGIDRENAGAYSSVRVRIKGSEYIFPNPVKVPELMEGYFAFYEAEKNRLHPVQFAALMHARLVKIHPFIDGNGRTARLVMNLMLLRAGYPITIIAAENTSRAAYYDALEKFDHDESVRDFERFIAENVRRWCLTYLDLFASDIAADRQDKGYYFFQKLQAVLEDRE